MPLRGNLHTHTTLSDGRLDPDAVFEAYRALGYDFLAFTDHRCFVGPGDEVDYWRKLPPSSPDLLVLKGIEEEPVALSGRHLGVIFGETEELRIINHPSEYAMTVEEVEEAVQAVGAHAVEITYHGRYLERYDVDAVSVPKVATDDMHHPFEIGRAWIEVDAAKNADAIVRAIKHGDFARYVDGHAI